MDEIIPVITNKNPIIKPFSKEIYLKRVSNRLLFGSNFCVTANILVKP